jgi:hypothetical protein
MVARVTHVKVNPDDVAEPVRLFDDSVVPAAEQKEPFMRALLPTREWEDRLAEQRDARVGRGAEAQVEAAAPPRNRQSPAGGSTRGPLLPRTRRSSGRAAGRLLGLDGRRE